MRIDQHHAEACAVGATPFIRSICVWFASIHLMFTLLVYDDESQRGL